jgi:hypothetical protein
MEIMERKKNDEKEKNIQKELILNRNSEEAYNISVNAKKILKENENKDKGKQIFQDKLNSNPKNQTVQQNDLIKRAKDNSSIEENGKDESKDHLNATNENNRNIRNEEINENKINDIDEDISKMKNFKNKNEFNDKKITEKTDEDAFILLNNYYKDIDLKFKADNTNNYGKNFLLKNKLNELPINYHKFQNYSQYSYPHYQNQIFNNMNYLLNYNQGSSYLYPQNNFIMNNHQNLSLINNIYINNIFHENKNKYNNKNKNIIEPKFFIINLDNILKGIDKRTTIMIRHIPNKYSYENIIEEINIVCKDKYDFFYLPLDYQNNCNLGYAFINFINPLHIIYFYKTFKSRKWLHYNSYKECDLTFARFQGRNELISNIEKKFEKNSENKKKPLIFQIKNPPKIDLFKQYYEIIKQFKPDIMNDINWI